MRHSAMPATEFQPFSQMNTTPLIDVLLVLLIMFILTIPAQTHKVAIDLPARGESVTAQPETHRLAIAAGYLLVARRVETALFLVVAIAGGALASTSLKLLFSRARPELVQHLVEVANASFPSGHAMNSAITYLTLGALLARTEKSTAIRIYLIALAILLTLTIGFSRVYLGVHWPSDVIAGWCLGGAWSILCSLAARTLQRRHMLEPEG